MELVTMETVEIHSIQQKVPCFPLTRGGEAWSTAFNRSNYQGDIFRSKWTRLSSPVVSCRTRGHTERPPPCLHHCDFFPRIVNSPCGVPAEENAAVGFSQQKGNAVFRRKRRFSRVFSRTWGGLFASMEFSQISSNSLFFFLSSHPCGVTTLLHTPSPLSPPSPTAAMFVCFLTLLLLVEEGKLLQKFVWESRLLSVVLLRAGSEEPGGVKKRKLLLM